MTRSPNPLPSPAAALGAARFAVLVLLAAGAAFAQPFVACCGFGRPDPLGRAENRPGIAAATDAGVPFAYWDSGEAVVRARLDRPRAEPEVVSPGRGVRQVGAVTVGGDAAVLWVRRDLGTGRTAHVVRWRGEERVLLDELQPYPVALGAGPSGPAIAWARTVDGRMTLSLRRWDGGETVVARSDRGIARVDLSFGPDGEAHLSWLDGFNDRGAVGVAYAEWDARYARVQADGSVQGPVDLGPAINRGLVDRTSVSATPAGPVVLWTAEGGRLVAAAPGGEPQVVGRGTAVGAAGGWLLWLEEASLRGVPVAAALEPGSGGAEARNLAWSPGTPELAATTTTGDTTWVAWYGPSVRGGFALHATSDAAPFRPAWRDRLAARMGWSPWSLWEALAGQLLASLLAGVLGTMVLTPAFWLASILFAGRLKDRGGLLAGIATATLAVLAPIAWILLRSALPPASRDALVGSPLALVAALGLGAASSWAILRRRDQDTQLRILVGAWLTSLVSLSLLAFVNFRGWTETFGAVL